MDLHFHIQTPDGKAEPAAFPAELSVRELIDQLVTDESMRIKPADPDRWHLFDENTGEQLDPKKTLLQNRVGQGHLLKMLPRKDDEARPPKPAEEGSRALIRCDNGHYYDPKKHTKCPFCGVAAINFEVRSLKIGSSSEEHTRPAGLPAMSSNQQVSDDAVTRAAQMVPDSARIDPVVGWLVAIGGPEKGKDYRIRSENNTVGRGKDMYICISGDDSISRERHTVITFDPQRNAFHLSPGEGRGLVYLNGEAVLSHKQLAPFDEILLGKTKLKFVPFCGDKFKWE
jgi:hypothetical protein